MPRTTKSSQKTVKKAMHKYKRGTLTSGRSGKKVTKRSQAIAIGLSEARKNGANVPKKRPTKKRVARKTTTRKSTSKAKRTKKKSS